MALKASKIRGREGYWTLILAAVSCLLFSVLFLSFFSSEFPEISHSLSLTSSLGFFLLIDLNIIVVMVLVFLVAKNLIRLFLDRKRGILGARLRSRLVLAFVGLSLIPTALLFLIARGIVQNVLEGMFSPQIKASVEGALSVAKYHYDEAEERVLNNVLFLGEQVSVLMPSGQHPVTGTVSLDPQTRQKIRSLLAAKRAEYGLFEISLVDAFGKDVIRVTADEPRYFGLVSPMLDANVVVQSLSGKGVVHPEQSISGEFLRGYAQVGSKLDSVIPQSGPPTEGSDDRPFNGVVSVTYWIDPAMVGVLSSVVDAYDDYQELWTYRRPLSSTYLLTLVVVTLLIVFAAIWVGFYLARGISIPIGQLALGTAQVAAGNLDYKISDVGDDELGVLVRSFNTMTGDLKATTDELVARRRYMETVLASVAVGVVSIERDYTVTTCNAVALEMLGLSGLDVLRQDLRMLVPNHLSEQMVDFIEELFAGKDRTLRSNVSLAIQKRRVHLDVTATKLSLGPGAASGAVLLLDDITELVSAQRVAAWREVARRIAHEIKNPLTPIQLSAERISRRLLQTGVKGADSEIALLLPHAERELVAESTGIIVKQVESLRQLVNEFSRFARMPRSELRSAWLNRVIDDAVAVFKESNPDIEFVFTPDAQLPMFALDPEQMGRVFVNLIDNGIASIKEAKNEFEQLQALSQNKKLGTINISTTYDTELGIVSVSVSDTGIGIAEADRERLFEPYFSKKRGGTGLGLSVVSTIVTDHQGFIRIRDNSPRGVTFVIELPVVSNAARRVNS